jgi:CBS domain-containing protein
MKLEQFMTRNVQTIAPEETLYMAAQKMRDHNIGFLPVEANGALVGVLTDRDITTRSTADGGDPRLTSVGEIMTTDVVTCNQEQSAESAAEAMNMHQIRRLIVTNQDKAVVGIVSLGDLAVDAINNERAGEVLQNVSWPAKPEQVK